jgi:carboxynorspermidine decarboxylase
MMQPLNLKFDINSLATPCYVVDQDLVENNLKILKSVRERADCKILLALKGFSMFALADLVNQYLDGVAASSLNEAKLGRDEFNKEVHTYAPAFHPNEISQILDISDHVVFNSLTEWQRHKTEAVAKGKRYGLRVNPHYSEVEVLKYNPCAPFSRFGVPAEELKNVDWQGITGLHFHTMCEQGSDVLQRVLAKIKENCSAYFDRIEWINFGGGHHISRKDYDVELLVKMIKEFKNKFNLEVYLEPGEAIALHTGYLVTTVLDIFHNGMDVAVLDCSATAHMPDVLEMPYRPHIIGTDESYEYRYRLGGMTCLSGDVIGDYAFEQPLKVGDKLVFTDMAHYTMVKNTTFNGVALPDIVLASSREGWTRVVKSFGYEDYKSRLS